jgi:hypothetical protein
MVGKQAPLLSERGDMWAPAGSVARVDPVRPGSASLPRGVRRRRRKGGGRPSGQRPRWAQRAQSRAARSQLSCARTLAACLSAQRGNLLPHIRPTLAQAPLARRGATRAALLAGDQQAALLLASTPLAQAVQPRSPAAARCERAKESVAVEAFMGLLACMDRVGRCERPSGAMGSLLTPHSLGPGCCRS